MSIQRNTLRAILFAAIYLVAFPSFATTFTVTFNDASTGFVTSGTNDQEIVYITVYNPNGGGQSAEDITGMDFTPDVTLNSDVTSAKLYYTTTSTFATTTQLGSADTDLSNGISFTFTQNIGKSNSAMHYFWLAFDVSSGATDCDILNATQVSGDITTPATVTYTDNTSGNVTIGPGIGCWNYCTVAGNTSGVYTSQLDFNTLSNASSFDGYINTGLSTTVQRTVSYTLSVQIYNPGSNNLYTAAWIDWNNDGDFTDAGENVLTSALTSVAIGTSTRTASVTVGATATLGTTRMRVVTKFNSNLTGSCDPYTVYIDWEDYDIIVAASPSAMVYSSSSTTQSVTSSVNAGSASQQVVGVEIEMTGTTSALDLSSMDFNTTGTTTTSDVKNGKLWYTGNSAAFAMTNQIGATLASPSGSFSFSASETLSTGTNYFWLTYDVVAGATGGNMIDASGTAVEVDGSFYVPSPSDPGSGRSIIAATNMVYTSATTVQNSSPVPKNSTDNHVVGIEVVVDGALNAFDVTNISLTENSTSTSDIENAKVYYTGVDGTFATTNQFGSTTASPSGTFSISGTQALQSGTNYFWVTYDTKSTATGGNTIDMNCNSVTVDGSVKTPTLTAPLGSREIISGAPYFSTGSNDLTQLSSWDSERDGSGSAPSSFSSAYSFWVQDGHSMTTSSTNTVPYMYVESGGYVTASYLITYTEMRILSGGIYEQTALATYAGYITNFYIHVRYCIS